MQEEKPNSLYKNHGVGRDGQKVYFVTTASMDSFDGEVTVKLPNGRFITVEAGWSDE